LDIDDNNQVKNFYSKPHPENLYYKNLVNAGVYILSSEIFKYIPNEKSTDFGKDIFPLLLKSDEKIAAYKSAEYCKDMGTRERLLEVTDDLIAGKVERLNKKNKRKCIFLDRDGTINKYVDNLSDIENFELIDVTAEAVRKINESEYLAIVATNQPMIAKGYLSEEELLNIHKKMETLLGKNHAYLNDIYYCPHYPESGFEGEIKELKIDCDCRKPKPGMLLKASKEYNIDLKNSWMIGDRMIDVLAGKNALCKTIYINDSLEKIENSDFVFKNILEAVEFIISQ
jgi:D,D-heptose 1,7-bisphosphate phosphatase